MRLHLLLCCIVVLSSIETTIGFNDEKCDSLDSHDCAFTETAFFECPIACSKLLNKEGSIARLEDFDAFYEQEVTKADGRKLSLEDNEGYVTLYAMVPLVPSAQYYYELLEHVQTIFPYTVEILLTPYIPENSKKDKTVSEIKPRENTKVTFLKMDTRPDLLFFLWEAKVYGGVENMKDNPLPSDRMTIYLVSFDGRFVEKLVCPALMELERRILVMSQQMNNYKEL